MLEHLPRSLTSESQLLSFKGRVMATCNGRTPSRTYDFGADYLKGVLCKPKDEAALSRRGGCRERERNFRDSRPLMGRNLTRRDPGRAAGQMKKCFPYDRQSSMRPIGRTVSIFSFEQPLDCILTLICFFTRLPRALFNWVESRTKGESGDKKNGPR